MAHKSKTQRARAAQAKLNKKDRLEREAAAGITSAADGSSSSVSKTENKPVAKQQVAAAKKDEPKAKPKKSRFQFFNDVRAEMKRVTWPSRQDVMRWSGVVVGALVFFGVYVAILDGAIVTPALYALTSLGA